MDSPLYASTPFKSYEGRGCGERHPSVPALLGPKLSYLDLHNTVFASNKSANDLATSASRARLHTLSLSDLNCRLVIDGRRSHALLDLPSHGQESLLDV